MREHYEVERRSEHRTYARDHSFEEWCWYQRWREGQPERLLNHRRQR